MKIARKGRLKEGETLGEIIGYLIDNHPRGLKRSEIQDKLLQELGIGESSGGVNRQLKRLRSGALIEWNQQTYTYTLPADFDSKDYFIRVTETLNMSTDRSYFLFLRTQKVISEKTRSDVDDHLGHRYDTEMNENIMALHNEYKMGEIRIHDTIARLTTRHNSYVRLKLFKTANEGFFRDLTQLTENDATRLTQSYANNLKTIEYDIKNEIECIFKIRGELIGHLGEKRLSRRTKFLIRYALNNARPSHMYDGLI
jgi:hypothetical protein